MNNRDKAIIESVSKFRVLDRDQIINLHFSNIRDPISSANRVLKRLVRDNYLTYDPTRKPYNYFLNPSPIKKDSGKIFHFKAIADFVISAIKQGGMKEYDIEIKLGDKGTVEPDVFMIWQKSPFFVEVQRSNQYSKSYMEKKFKRYEDYYNYGDWSNFSWQRQDKPVFPYIWIVSDNQYTIKTDLKVFQSKSVEDFVSKYFKKN